MPARPKPLRARHDGWTPERQQIFLTALAACRSVTAAAGCTGMSLRSVYKLRDHPAATAFRKAWDAALAAPPAAPLSGRIDAALADETAAFLCDGVVVVRSWPISANRLIRLLHRADTHARKRANSSTS